MLVTYKWPIERKSYSNYFKYYISEKHPLNIEIDTVNL